MCVYVCTTVHACVRVCVCVRVICELNVLGVIKWTTTLSTQRRGRFIGHAVSSSSSSSSSEGRLKDSFRFHSRKLATFCGMFCDLIWKLSQIVRESFLALPKLWMKHLLWFDSSVWVREREREKETYCKRAQRTWRAGRAVQSERERAFTMRLARWCCQLQMKRGQALPPLTHCVGGACVCTWVCECQSVWMSEWACFCVCVSARVLHEYVHSVLDGTLQGFIVFNNTYCTSFLTVHYFNVLTESEWH